ncbi:hypothetical protein [Liquorilactobacillus capillatus]|uniref:DUF2628 domain-containing protein n=1 Tax=Liquorilactobacillus capillatus DSM 19910 TaxID=1423731 RepID=A0A0R1M3P9_9LACO|nr:hypothetical protein [Liquorilactobacillus capillatus]KRL02377.1 hypothetical protein FC81_GL000720 [Liquorilactobacillus capillatus DSM 19910]
MNFAELFGFNDRVLQDTVMVREINGKTIKKQVKGSFNWLGGIFTIFYAVFSQKYKTTGFVAKIAIPFVIALVVNIIVSSAMGSVISLILNLAELAWFGSMYDTWFKNQLLANGYTEEGTTENEH